MFIYVTFILILLYVFDTHKKVDFKTKINLVIKTRQK